MGRPTKFKTPAPPTATGRAEWHDTVNNVLAHLLCRGAGEGPVTEKELTVAYARAVRVADLERDDLKTRFGGT